MSTVNIYGGSGGNTFTCPDPPPGNTKLITYMKTYSSIMKDLNNDRNKQKAIDRIELIKAQIIVDLGGVSKLIPIN
jgi:hypothetical protein